MIHADNPFAYIHSEKDILKLVTTLIANTKGEGKAGDDFWVKAETLLYTTLIGYIHYGKRRWRNRISLRSLSLSMRWRCARTMRTSKIRGFDVRGTEKAKVNHFASVRQYAVQLSAGKTAKSLIPAVSRLAR